MPVIPIIAVRPLISSAWTNLSVQVAMINNHMQYFNKFLVPIQNKNQVQSPFISIHHKRIDLNQLPLCV